MFIVPRNRQLWNPRRFRTFHLARPVSFSILDADVLAAAQKMVKETDLAQAEKTRHLKTLKVQMPADDEHAKALVQLNRQSKGLWFMYPFSARSAPFNRRMFLTYDSYENALNTLDALRGLNQSMSLQFRAQLWHEHPYILEPSSPGVVLAIYLGFHSQLKDVHYLFEGWPKDLRPIGIRLGYDLYVQRLTGYATFKSVEKATSAKLRLEASAALAAPGGPPILVGYAPKRPEWGPGPAPEGKELIIWGLGPRASSRTVQSFFRWVPGLRDVRVLTDWKGHSNGVAFLSFDSTSCAKSARSAIDGLMFPPSGDNIRTAFSRQKGTLEREDQLGPRVTLRLTPRQPPSNADKLRLRELLTGFQGLWHVWERFRFIDTKHVPQLCLRFGTQSDAEAALKLCNSHLNAIWEGDIGPAESPGRLHDTTPPKDDSKELCISLSFHDRLQDVKDAVIPLGAVSVRLFDRKEGAHVVFSSAEAARAARGALQDKSLRDGGPPISFTEMPDDGDHLRSRDNLRNNALWVAGLGRRTTKKSFNAFFKSAPGFEEGNIHSHWSGVSLGYGYAFFRSADEAQAAREALQGTIYPDSGNPVTINYLLRRPEQNAYLEVVENFKRYAAYSDLAVGM